MLEEDVKHLESKLLTTIDERLSLNEQSWAEVEKQILEAIRTIEPKLLKMANEAAHKMETKFTNQLKKKFKKPELYDP